MTAGYSDLTGGYEGGQAEYARVPFGAQDVLSMPLGMQPPVFAISYSRTHAW